MEKAKNEISELEKLRNHLRTVPPGKIADVSAVERLLAECWDELGGDYSGMEGYKLLDRTESLTWEPPVLSFEIERHGLSAIDPQHAEVQHWKIDVKKGIAKCDECGQKRISCDTREHPAVIDRLRDFIDQRCAAIPSATVKEAELYEEYKDWAEKKGGGVASRRLFDEMLLVWGFEKVKRGDGTRVWRGLGLNVDL